MVISLGNPFSENNRKSGQLLHFNRCQVIYPKEEIQREPMITEHLGMRQVKNFHHDVKIVMNVEEVTDSHVCLCIRPM